MKQGRPNYTRLSHGGKHLKRNLTKNWHVLIRRQFSCLHAGTWTVPEQITAPSPRPRRPKAYMTSPRKGPVRHRRKNLRILYSRPDDSIHRRRMETEAKLKIVASVWGTEFIPFLAMLAILPRSIWKNRINSTVSSKLSRNMTLLSRAMTLLRIIKNL